MSIVERKLRSDTFIRLNGKYGSVFAKIKETIEKVPDKFKIDDLVLKLNAILMLTIVLYFLPMILNNCTRALPLDCKMV